MTPESLSEITIRPASNAGPASDLKGEGPSFDVLGQVDTAVVNSRP